MKHNLQDIKAVRYIGLVLLVLTLALVSSRLAAATPPDDPIGNTQESQFDDVSTSHWAAAWIKQAAAEGIFSGGELVSDGCAAGNFCPETPVTRALMAGLLMRTFNLP